MTHIFAHFLDLLSVNASRPPQGITCIPWEPEHLIGEERAPNFSRRGFFPGKSPLLSSSLSPLSRLQKINLKLTLTGSSQESPAANGGGFKILSSKVNSTPASICTSRRNAAVRRRRRRSRGNGERLDETCCARRRRNQIHEAETTTAK